MKKKTRRFLAVMLTAMMVLGMGTVAMADWGFNFPGLPGLGSGDDVDWQKSSEMVIYSPEADDSYLAGAKMDISWAFTLDTSVIMAEPPLCTLMFSSDGGATWELVAEDLPNGATPQHYQWTVPSISSEKCMIRALVTIPPIIDLPGINTAVLYQDSGEFTISKLFIPTLPLLPINLLPAAPSDLDADDIDINSAVLSWKDNSSNETGFVLERKLQGGSYATIATLDEVQRTSYEDTGLSANKTYVYRVKAYNSVGSSDYSSELEVTTPKLMLPIYPLLPPGSVTMKFYIGSTDYYVNGGLKSMDQAPIIMETRTVLPIRFVADALGATVAWDEAQRKVTITGTKTIELWIDNPWAKVNGVSVLIDPDNQKVRPIIMMPAGRTMMPLRFITETLGCQVEWNGAIQEVLIKYPKDV